MGASDFYTMSFGRDVREAFGKAIEEARWESGHGGYTGTIAEKDSYRIIPESEVKGKNRIRYAEKLVDPRIRDKWGPAGAIRITGEAEKRYRRRNGLVGKKGQVWYFFGWASS